MISFQVKPVKLEDGTETIAVCEFNEGRSHIIPDQHCWVLINDGRVSPWIFSEALRALRFLPDSPADHQDLIKFINKGFEGFPDQAVLFSEN